MGREAERARLAAWMDARFAARGGAAPTVPVVLLVSGESGVGKSALLHACRPVAARVLDAHGTTWAAAPVQLLGQLTSGGPPTDAPALREALLAGGTPLLLVLEDLQGADAASLDLLPALAEVLADDPVAVIGSYRTDQLARDHRLREVRAELRRARHLEEVRLESLDHHGVRELLTACLGALPDAALVTAVTERSEGLPFFVEELAAAMAASGRVVSSQGLASLAGDGGMPLPESVRDAIALRISFLGPRSRQVLEAAAVLGTTFDTERAAALVDAARLDWPDDLDECGVLAADADGAGERTFRHTLAHRAVYAGAPWSQRRALHRRAAEALSAAAAAPAEIARHLQACGDVERARPVLLAASRIHLAAGACRDAAGMLTTALEAWPRGVDEDQRLQATDDLARCQERIGNHLHAIALLRELLPSFDRTATGDLHRRLAIQDEQLGQGTVALAAREAAAAAFSASGRPGDAAVEQLAMAVHLRSAASYRAALEVVSSATCHATAAGRTDLVARAVALRGNLLARLGRTQEGLAAVHAALDVALGAGLLAVAAEIYQRLADALEHAGDYRAAGRAYVSAAAFCDVNDQAATGQLCRACATVMLFFGGRWEDALSSCGQVLADPAASAHARAVATGISGLVHAMSLRDNRALPLLLEARASAVRIDLVAVELIATWGLALLEESGGRVAGALEWYRHVVARCGQTEERHYSIPVLQFALACFAGAGTSADIDATTSLIAEAVAATGQDEPRVALAHGLGESALRDGSATEAAAHLERAIDLLHGLNLPVVDTLVRHRSALALASVGDVDGALALLADAERTARRLKARLLVARIREDVTGLAPAPPRAPRPASGSGGHAGLSPRERQVLHHVGEGLTSREIGQRLFLSVRTVDMHVANAADKLGCRTRAEAVRCLIEQDRGSQDAEIARAVAEVSQRRR